jgi:hypothetical protein
MLLFNGLQAIGRFLLCASPNLADSLFRYFVWIAGQRPFPLFNELRLSQAFSHVRSNHGLQASGRSLFKYNLFLELRISQAFSCASYLLSHAVLVEVRLQATGRSFFRASHNAGRSSLV